MASGIIRSGWSANVHVQPLADLRAPAAMSPALQPLPGNLRAPSATSLRRRRRRRTSPLNRRRRRRGTGPRRRCGTRWPSCGTRGTSRGQPLSNAALPLQPLADMRAPAATSLRRRRRRRTRPLNRRWRRGGTGSRRRCRTRWPSGGTRGTSGGSRRLHHRGQLLAPQGLRQRQRFPRRQRRRTSWASHR